MRTDDIPDIEIRSGENPELDSALGRGLYEFNSSATGIYDGELFHATIRGEGERIVAGINGHTWGGCCEVSRLWIHESMRGQGLGTLLMQAAEDEALRRGCRQMVLSTHSFQAPKFYEGLGFTRLATVPNYPKGYEQYFYIKELPAP